MFDVIVCDNVYVFDVVVLVDVVVIVVTYGVIVRVSVIVPVVVGIGVFILRRRFYQLPWRSSCLRVQIHPRPHVVIRPATPPSRGRGRRTFAVRLRASIHHRGWRVFTRVEDIVGRDGIEMMTSVVILIVLWV